jgi:CRISP-associated protein Cas1
MATSPLVPFSSLGAAPDQDTRRLPDYLPARMVNEFVYCPRLFFYEWVDGLFHESADTVEGKIQHRRADAGPTATPKPFDDAARETIHSRSLTLSSERLRVIAKLDLLEGEGGVFTPVDYKHGKPRDMEDGLALWPSDRVQLAIQGMLLRENGYPSEEGVVFYQATRQRVRMPFDEAVIAEAERAIAEAWRVGTSGQMPPPLEDSPKCPGCSMNGICLPDEMNFLKRSQAESGDIQQLSLFAEAEATGKAPRKPARAEGGPTRGMIAPRQALRPFYLNTQGMRVGKSGEVLQVKLKDKLEQEVRIGEISQVNLMGNIQLTTQATQVLCEANVPVAYFSQGGWFYGLTVGMNTKNVFLRKKQYKLADEEWFARSLSKSLVAGKIRNQRVMVQRNHVEPPAAALLGLKQMVDQAERATSLEQLLGIEGNAARLYFGAFSGLIKAEDEADKVIDCFRFDFEGRNRRPPRDPVNAMLSLAYSMLAKDLALICYAVGFDPMLGYYHQPRHGRPALALDLMEPFRPLIADSAVLSAINTRMVTAVDFVQAGPAVALTASGRKGFLRAYELRMDSLATHPIFDYRVSYRRMLEIQVRLLARHIEGEIDEYPVFVTR